LGPGSILPSLVHELLEEFQVLARFWVPEHAEGESAGRILDSLDRPVIGTCGLDESRA
jgi:hypothetical protein